MNSYDIQRQKLLSDPTVRFERTTELGKEVHGALFHGKDRVTAWGWWGTDDPEEAYRLAVYTHAYALATSKLAEKRRLNGRKVG